MNRKNTILYIAIFVLVFSFLWGLFITYGLGFFWEDLIFLPLDKETHPVGIAEPSRLFLAIEAFKGFAREFFVPRRLFQIGFATNYSDRPYQFLTIKLLYAVFGDKIILYKIFRSIFFSINALILFLIVKRVSLLLALLGVFLYITSGEVWVTLVHVHEPSIFAQCAVAICIMLFFKLLEKKPLRWKDLWIYYFLIMVISNYAVLTKGNGRYLAIIFFLTILFFHRSKLRFHLPMLTILLLMEVPVLGYIKKIFTDLPVSPINIVSHGSNPLPQVLQQIIKNNIFPRIAIGHILLIVLSITIFMHLLYIMFRKSRIVSKQIKPNFILREGLFTVMVWFIFTFVLAAISRSFSYSGPYSWSMRECSFFIGPFIIFLCYYIALIYGRFKKPYCSIFLIVCVSLIVVQILPVRLLRLNRYRGAWGNYFCAWQNTEKYIDNNSNNALALVFITMRYKPFVFRHSNNEVSCTMEQYEISRFCDLNYIETKFKEGGYEDIFVVRYGELKFRGNSKRVVLHQKKIIDGYTGDLYDRLKRFVGRRFKPIIHLYHFKFNNEQN